MNIILVLTTLLNSVYLFTLISAIFVSLMIHLLKLFCDDK